MTTLKKDSWCSNNNITFIYFWPPTNVFYMIIYVVWRSSMLLNDLFIMIYLYIYNINICNITHEYFTLCFDLWLGGMLECPHRSIFMLEMGSPSGDVCCCLFCSLILDTQRPWSRFWGTSISTNFSFDPFFVLTLSSLLFLCKLLPLI